MIIVYRRVWGYRFQTILRIPALWRIVSGSVAQTALIRIRIRLFTLIPLQILLHEIKKLSYILALLLGVDIRFSLRIFSKSSKNLILKSTFSSLVGWIRIRIRNTGSVAFLSQYTLCFFRVLTYLFPGCSQHTSWRLAGSLLKPLINSGRSWYNCFAVGFIDRLFRLTERYQIRYCVPNTRWNC